MPIVHRYAWNGKGRNCRLTKCAQPAPTLFCQHGCPGRVDGECWFAGEAPASEMPAELQALISAAEPKYVPYAVGEVGEAPELDGKYADIEVWRNNALVSRVFAALTTQLNDSESYRINSTPLTFQQGAIIAEGDEIRLYVTSGVELHEVYSMRSSRFAMGVDARRLSDNNPTSWDTTFITHKEAAEARDGVPCERTLVLRFVVPSDTEICIMARHPNHYFLASLRGRVSEIFAERPLTADNPLHTRLTEWLPHSGARVITPQPTISNPTRDVGHPEQSPASTSAPPSAPSEPDVERPTRTLRLVGDRGE